jgi:VanZ family protein
MLFLACGISGMLFFTTIDFIRHGTGKFGSYQLAGFVISAIIILAAMHNTQSSHAKNWFGALLLIYIAGILFMGLKPPNASLYFHHFPRHSTHFLIIRRPPIGDFIINILGFCPFAYLFMAYLFSGKGVTRIATPVGLVLSAGIGVSLFIESIQYYIPGRTSSTMDLIANAVGTLIGIAYFIVERKLADSR